MCDLWNEIRPSVFINNVSPFATSYAHEADEEWWGVIGALGTSTGLKPISVSWKRHWSCITKCLRTPMIQKLEIMCFKKSLYWSRWPTVNVLKSAASVSDWYHHSSWQGENKCSSNHNHPFGTVQQNLQPWFQLVLSVSYLIHSPSWKMSLSPSFHSI